MKPLKRVVLLLVFLVAFLLPLPGAVSGQIDLVSRFIWRGFDLLADNHAAIQPSLSIELGQSGFGLSLWSSFALSNRGTFKYVDEIDLNLSYDFAMPEGWEMTAGFMCYGYWFAKDFTFADSTSQEIFATVARTDLPLSPQISVYYDFNLGSGLYLTFGGSHMLKVSEKVEMEMGVLIGFNSRQYIDNSGFSNIDLYAKAALALDGVMLTPSLNVMIPLLDEVNEAVEIWFGLSAAM